MNSSSISQIKIQKLTENIREEKDDIVAKEEPLEIQILQGNKINSVAVTMRTPGHDEDLAIGFLFTEGMLKTQTDVIRVRALGENIVLVVLRENLDIDLKKSERNFYTTSSCGVCGKSSIEAIKVESAYKNAECALKISKEFLRNLPENLRSQQELFSSTGGIHASALFDETGKIIVLKEDVGRHNALDKLIGFSLMNFSIPLTNFVLLLSGRASFELIQKAAVAGIKIVAAVGAPSSLAIESANEMGITLVGFLKKNSFNIYTNAHRII